jgi:hypothetical protein
MIAYRNDVDRSAVTLTFDDDRWASYVPLRLPNTMCVQERLPSGAAGVLLNRSHPFHDLILVIDPQEKKMFDAIDGRRRIAEIVDRAGAARSSRVRMFFQKLWWYDQVAFDTSSALSMSEKQIDGRKTGGSAGS